MSNLSYFKKLFERSSTKSEPAEVNPTIEEKAQAFLAALGGKENISKIEACITRLRVTLLEYKKVDEAKLKALGSMGNVKVGKQELQIILGTEAKLIANTIKKIIE